MAQGFASPTALSYLADFQWPNQRPRPTAWSGISALAVSQPTALTLITLRTVDPSTGQVIVDEGQTWQFPYNPDGYGDYEAASLGRVAKGILCFDDIVYTGSKTYWSSDPDEFPLDHYAGWSPHVAREITCDTTGPEPRWFFTYTSIWDTGGWGMREFDWLPPIAAPVP